MFGNPISPDLNRPVEQVSWNDATNYCALLTRSDRGAGRVPSGWGYRLPTEAEREICVSGGDDDGVSFWERHTWGDGQLLRLLRV